MAAGAQNAASDLIQGLIAPPIGQPTIASNSEENSTQLGNDIRQNRLKMLRKELIGPEIEILNLRIDETLTQFSEGLKTEFMFELGKMQTKNKETMAMVEEVIGQIENLEAKVKHNQAQIAVSDEALD